jgi:hypothetical protein
MLFGFRCGVGFPEIFDRPKGFWGGVGDFRTPRDGGVAKPSENAPTPGALPGRSRISGDPAPAAKWAPWSEKGTPQQKPKILRKGYTPFRKILGFCKISGFAPFPAPFAPENANSAISVGNSSPDLLPYTAADCMEAVANVRTIFGSIQRDGIPKHRANEHDRHKIPHPNPSNAQAPRVRAFGPAADFEDISESRLSSSGHSRRDGNPSRFFLISSRITLSSTQCNPHAAANTLYARVPANRTRKLPISQSRHLHHACPFNSKIE